ncbi:MAG: TIGR03936 family radical SAM-associated protein [Candidatus Eiseniibacteriota bacterium]|jgi:radical SAM-linked protein
MPDRPDTRAQHVPAGTASPTLADLDEAVLPLVSRPGRYVPAILGLAVPAEGPTDLHAVVAGPDLIDGLVTLPQISALYYGLNDLEGCAADLAFAPAPDFEAELRRHRLPLAGLATRRPLATFDLMVIPVSSALQASGVLGLLDLGQVPWRATERDARHPLVVAVGPGVVNPEPLAPFLDAVVLGDVEPALPALARAARERRTAGSGREAALDVLAVEPGVNVPSRVAVVPGADGMLVAAPGTARSEARYTERHRPDHRRLQPLLDVRGDALELEVMRGCPVGCRFCQPARTGGPVREAAPGEVTEAARRLVADGGWDEIAVGGLMPAAWSGLRGGIEVLGRALWGTGTALSLTAASPESLERPVLTELSRMRRTALHIAPEAGSDRLRRLVGKPLDEARLLGAVRSATALGWPSLRLHFMIGLPTETDDDLHAIIELATRVRAAGRRPGSGLQVHLMVHPFVPRPHTPLQWESQLDPATLADRLQLLRRLGRRVAGRLKWRRPELVELEGLLARGDRRLAEVIETAYRDGARLDGWIEHHRSEIWERALARHDLDAVAYRATREPGTPLPWSHLGLGWSEAELGREHAAALAGELPAGSTGQMAGSSSGAPAPAATRGVVAGRGDVPAFATTPESEVRDREAERRFYGRQRKRRRGPATSDTVPRYRVRYARLAPARFLSHLDMVRAIDRGARRAGLQVAYSTGYSRHPKLSFGPPLPVGMLGHDEYVDVELKTAIEDELIARLQPFLPPGIELLAARPIVSKVDSLMSLIDHAEYRTELPDHARRLIGDPHAFTAELESAVQTFLSHERAYVTQRGPHGERPVEIRTGVRRLEIQVDGDDAYPCLVLDARLTGEGAVRPLDLVGFLLGEHRLDPRLLRVHRLRVYGRRGEHEIRPFDALEGDAVTAGIVQLAHTAPSGGGRRHVKGNRHQRGPARDKDRHSRRW